MDDFNSLSISVDLFGLARISVRWPCGAGSWCGFSSRRAHRFENSFVRDDHRAVAGIAAHEEAAAHFAARFCEYLIATRMVRARIRVHNESNRLARKLTDCRHHFVAVLRKSRVYQQYTVISHLHGDITARTCNQVHVSLNGQYLNIACLL